MISRKFDFCQTPAIYWRQDLDDGVAQLGGGEREVDHVDGDGGDNGGDVVDNHDDNAVAHLGGGEEEGAGLATLPLPQAPSISLHLRVAY